MSLFDSIMGGLSSKDPAHAALYDEVGKLVAQNGGVSGVVTQFQQKGLGGLVSSWVSNGANAAITPDQLTQVIGSDRVKAIAAKAGLSEDQVSAGITKMLPTVIDHLTPNGQVPDHSPTDLTSAIGMLKSKLFS